jgi:alkanesulfonate monooxygenase SsuD/methylene tetrahydromethanopterin reductase-like flavin-dependent oxidoreductase (luciferase family)
MAQATERACFDYIMLEDTLMVSEAYGGTSEAALKHCLQVPKHDPIPLAAMIASGTSRMGVVATMSTMAYPPFMLARASTTLDHIAGGRFGWNIVTSGEDAAAQEIQARPRGVVDAGAGRAYQRDRPVARRRRRQEPAV